MKEIPRKTARRIRGRMSSPSLDGPTHQRYQDFMREGAGAQAELQNLIDRMFNGA
jgi:hypothetical protein